MDLGKIRKIGIIGVGFMGGSLALALKRKFPRIKVWGFARSQNSYRKLKKLGILDKVDKDLGRVVADADLVVLALPVIAITVYFKKIAAFLKKKAIVLDLGSTKQLIEAAARRNLPAEVNFIGCHPLAGSEKSGAEFSRPDLYKNSICIITSGAESKAVKTTKQFWQSLGCRVIFLSSRKHDEILSSVSHLPHILSFALVNFVPANRLKFSPASFRDLTRIANSPAAVWSDIFLSNRRNISRDLSRYIQILEHYQKLLKAADKEALSKIINQANRKQKQIV